MPLTHHLNELDTIRRLLEGSEAIARAAGDDLPGAEHLLLAALALPDGTARAAFVRAGAEPDGLAAAIEQQHDDALRAVGIDAGSVTLADAPPPAQGRVFRATPSAQHAFRRAVELSASPKPRRLLGAHVVAAVCESDQGSAARAIRRLGVEPVSLGAAAMEELAHAG
jgi:ATP-dependent Clp protease ATP-binding subunit ClpA